MTKVEMKSVIERKDVQKMIEVGVQKDLRTSCYITEQNFLNVICDRDVIEIGYVNTDFDIKEMNLLLMAEVTQTIQRMEVSNWE